MYLPSYRTKKNGVPVLSKTEIDSIAEKYILDFSPEAMRTPTEIDIDAFGLYYLGLKQDFQYLSHNGVYLGMTVFNDTNKVPVYDPDMNRAEYISSKARTVIIDNMLLDEDQEHRYRYTMGHECGHDIFHRGYFQYNRDQLSMFEDAPEPMIKCRKVPETGKTKPVSEWDEKDSMEWQANYLSSALLMPKSMVKKLIVSLPEEHDFFRNAVYTWEVSKTFNVSLEAARYRLKELRLFREKSSEVSLLESII